MNKKMYQKKSPLQLQRSFIRNEKLQGSFFFFFFTVSKTKTEIQS